MVNADQINDLKARVAKLSASIDVEQRRIDLQNEQERTEEPNFWDNPDEARKQLKKVADIKSVIEDWESALRTVSDLDLVPDFVSEGVLTEAEAEARFNKWVEAKSGKIEAKTNKLAADAKSAEKARLAAEAKVNEERAQAIAEKKAAAEAAAAEAAAEATEEAATEEAAE